MEHSFVRWGGRASRFAEFPRGVIRQVDPIAGQPLGCSTDLQFENWLLHRFNPDVAELRLPRRNSLHLPEIPRLKATVHLDITWKDGSRELQLVGNATEVPESLRKLGRALEATTTVRTPKLIRGDITLITNLRHLRRQMQQHGEEPAASCNATDAAILRLLATEPRSVSQLSQALIPMLSGHVDARLGHLHVQGFLVINLGGQLYGDRTVVRKA